MPKALESNYEIQVNKQNYDSNLVLLPKDFSTHALKSIVQKITLVKSQTDLDEFVESALNKCFGDVCQYPGYCLERAYHPKSNSLKRLAPPFEASWWLPTEVSLAKKAKVH